MLNEFIKLQNGDWITARQILRISLNANDDYVALLEHGAEVTLADEWRQREILPNYNQDLVHVFYYDDLTQADGLYLVFRDIVAWQQEQSWLTPLNAGGLMNSHNPGAEILIYNTKTHYWYVDGGGCGMTAKSMLDFIYKDLDKRRKRRKKNDRQIQLTLVKPSEE